MSGTDSCKTCFAISPKHAYLISLLMLLLCCQPHLQPATTTALPQGQATTGRTELILAAQAPVEEYKAPPGVDQDRVIAYHNQGNQFLALEMWDDAEAQFREAIRLDPNNPYSYNGLALAQYGRGEYPLAITSCQQAISLQPGYAYVRCTLALALFQSGSRGAAVEVLEEAQALSAPGEEAYTLATALLTRFRQKLADEPGSAMFSLQAGDDSVAAFLQQRESFEDIFVSSPFTAGSTAPGAASAEYERLRAAKVAQVLSDSADLVQAAAGLDPVLRELESVVNNAANELADAIPAQQGLAAHIRERNAALAGEQREAADFLARLDTGSKDEFVRSSLEYQRSLMAMRLGSLQLQQVDNLIKQAAVLVATSRGGMGASAADYEQRLLAGLAVHDREAGRKARLDHALHYVDDGLRALDTADYYYGLEAVAFMRTEMASVRFRAMNLRTSDRIDKESARLALGTVDWLDALSRELQEQFDNMDTSRLLDDAELRAMADDAPGGALRAAMFVLSIDTAYADDKVYSQNVQRALQRDRRLFDRSTSEYEGIPHAIGGMVRATQDLAGSTVDTLDALVSTAVIPVAGAWYGDSGQEIWREIKGKYTAVGENYRNGTSGTRVFRTATEYMEATEGYAEQAASKTVRVLSDATVGGGNFAPWLAGKLAKTGVGMFTAMGKGVNKVLDPTSTPGEVSHGVLHIGLTVASAGTGGLSAPVEGVSNAVRTAAGMGANGGMRELTAALGQGYLTDSGKELLEWGEDYGTGFERRPNPFLPGGPQISTPPTGSAPGTGQPAAAGSGNQAGNTGGSGGNGAGGNPQGDAGNSGTDGDGDGNAGNGGGAAGQPSGGSGGSGGAGGNAPGGTASSGGGNGAGNGSGGSGEGLPSEDTVPDSDLPSCSITASTLAGPAPLTVSFSMVGWDASRNMITRFEFSGTGISGWEVGNRHTQKFDSPGEYKVQAVAIDAQGRRSLPAELTINAYGKPKAVLGSVPAGGYAPLQLNLDFSGSTASGEGVQKYEFNDGKGGVHNGSSVSLQYDAPGGRKQYTVSLTVYDANGNASEPVTASFSVYSEPVAAILLGTELGAAPLDVAVDGTASQCFNGQFSKVEITDTAGHSASGSLSTSFRYEEPGTYTITLAVTDAGGKTSKVSASVEVTKQILQGVLSGSFSEPAPGRLELTLNAAERSFTGFVSGVVNWKWGDMSGSVPYSGNLSGSYDPDSGALSGTLTGVCDGKPYSGTFSGTASGGSASGGWTAANEDGSYEGSWKAGG
ncbi:MAG: tetratricopeptide repeat protein [Planctomycetales bacterium]|nr:MAG: tetratricopeptide repeat protein [Planctomycetales bacterium]